MPSTAQTAFVWGPKGHLTKALGIVWARTLFFLLIILSTLHSITHLSNSGAYPTPNLPGLNRAAGRRTGALFFVRLLDYFIITQKCSFTYRDLVPSRQFHHDTRLRVHLPVPIAIGMAKNEGLSKTTPAADTGGK